MVKSMIYALQGALVGIGAILPGVSGGVLCVAFGVYEPMMALLTQPVATLKKRYRLLVPFCLGWLLGAVLLAKAVAVLFSLAAGVMLMLFLGLICGTLPELFKVSERSDPQKSWTPFVLSLVLSYFVFRLLEHGGGVAMAPNFASFLLCGALWGLSLVVPGLTSSSLLIFLGLYEPMTAGIGALDVWVLLPMILGIAITALPLAKGVTVLYRRHYAVISRTVLGFVVASTLTVFPSSFDTPIMLMLSLLCFAAGFAVARGMDVIGNKQQMQEREKKT